MFNEGISKEGELIEVGTELGILKKSGAFYALGDVKLGQGRENVKVFLKDNPEIALEIKRLITEDGQPAPEDDAETPEPVAAVGAAGAD